MKYISKRDYNKQLKQIQIKNESIRYAQMLKEEKKKYRQTPHLPSTSKLMAVYLFILFNIVLAYSMIAMWHFADLAYLGALITDIAAQVLTYFIYAKKSTAENTAGGIVHDIALGAITEEDAGEDI